MLNARNSTMVIISHDRHFLNSVCTHMADLDYGKITRLSRATTTTTCWPRRRRATQQSPTTPRPRKRSPNCRTSCAASRPTRPRRARPPRARADRQDQDRGHQAFQPPVPVHPLRIRRARKAASPRGRSGEAGQGLRPHAVHRNFNYRASKPARRSPSSAPTASARPRCCAAWRAIWQAGAPAPCKWAEKAKLGYFAQDHAADFADDKIADRLDDPVAPAAGDDDQAGARHAGPAAVLRRRREEIGEGAVRRRKGPHDVRQADAAASPTCC